MAAPKNVQWLSGGSDFTITHYTYALENDPIHDGSPKVSASGLNEQYKQGFLSTPYGVAMQGTGKAENDKYIRYNGKNSDGTINYAYGVGGAYRKITEPYKQIAVDSSVIPYGSKVYVECYDKIMSADDCGSAIKGNHIDVFAGAVPIKEAYALGTKYGKVGIVKDDGETNSNDNTGGSTGGNTASGGASAGGETIYTVQPGDTLGAIADSFHVQGGFKKLAEYNGIANPDFIYVGQQIKIPGTGGSASTGGATASGPSATDNATSTATSPGSASPSPSTTASTTSAAPESPAPAETSNTHAAAPTEIIHVVQSGETLSQIAAAYGIADFQDLADYNGIANPNIISIGQKIKIPSSLSGKTGAGSQQQQQGQQQGDPSAPSFVPETSEQGVGAKRSSLASGWVEFGYTNSTERNQDVSKITIHHMAGNGDPTSTAIWHRDSAGVSANYYIGSDGTIIGGVDETRRAWTSYSSSNDQRAITFEVANNSGAPNWTISDAAYKSMIALCRDICSRYGISPYFDGTPAASLTAHYMFTDTECPGPYIRGMLENHKIENDIKGSAGGEEQQPPTEQTENTDPQPEPAQTQAPATDELDGPAPMPNTSLDAASQDETVLMAMNIYAEARGQSDEGKSAVGQVVYNRANGLTASGKKIDWYGGSIKGVITKPYQFSWLNNTSSAEYYNAMHPKESEGWSTCYYFAKKTINGGGIADLKRASDGRYADSYCNLKYCSPDWGNSANYIKKIGDHTFFTTWNPPLVTIPGLTSGETSGPTGTQNTNQNEQNNVTSGPTSTAPETNVQAMTASGQVHANGGLRLRPTPDTSLTELTMIPNNTWIDIIGQAPNGWYQVTYNGMTGYVSNDYVTIGEKPQGGSTQPAATTTEAVSSNGVPMFYQFKGGWENDVMAPGPDTLKQSGCVVTSIAMILNKISGNTNVNPGTLNQFLVNHGGYTDTSCVYWGVPHTMVGASKTSRPYSKEVIDDELNHGRPCSVRVKYNGHSVVVAGRNADGSYVIHDPGSSKGIKWGQWSNGVMKVEDCVGESSDMFLTYSM